MRHGPLLRIAPPWRVLQGVDACGPRPLADGTGDVFTEHFFAGAWGEYEWECVELVMRWMYIAYGVHPYSANGYQVVSNYQTSDGGGLVKYGNGTAGHSPQPGDVISFDDSRPATKGTPAS